MKKDIQIMSLVTTHNPINKIISPFVRQLNKILKTDDNMYQTMLNVTLITCMRQPKNLRRIRCIIVRPKWQHRRSQLQNAKTCVVQHVHIFNWVLHLILGERNSTCHVTLKILIMLLLARAATHFISETGSSLRATIIVHKQHIHFPEYRKIKLTEHIYVCRHGKFQEFPFYKLLSDNNIERREK